MLRLTVIAPEGALAIQETMVAASEGDDLTVAAHTRSDVRSRQAPSGHLGVTVVSGWLASTTP